MGLALLSRAHQLRDRHGCDRQPDLVEAYGQAVECLSALPLDENPHYIDDLGSAWTNQGIALAEGGRDELPLALACFDEAIRLRERLDVTDNPRFLHHLAGTWMNWALAAARLGGAARVEAARAAYDRILQLLPRIPRVVEPAWDRRRAIAWLNRGALLLQQGSRSDWPEAVRSFGEAFHAVNHPAGTCDPSLALLAASAKGNRADALARLDAREEARADARASLQILAAAGVADAHAVAIGLKARQALCQAAAQPVLRGSEVLDAESRREVEEALDAAEDGLRLTLSLGPAAAELEPGRRELFRFAAQAYARLQPHFLPEFIREHLREGEEPDRAVARRALRIAIAVVSREAFAALGTDRIERALSIFRELHAALATLPESPAPAGTGPGFSGAPNSTPRTFASQFGPP